MLSDTDNVLSLAERAYRELRDRIVRLELVPGSLLSEERLMRELGIGRTPLREAIKQLARDGLVVILPRRGTLVSDISFDHPLHIAEVREVIEALAARLAAKRMSDEQREGLQTLRAELKTVVDTNGVDSLIELDSRIHRTIHQLTGNPFLTATLDTHYNLALRVWYAAGSRVRDPTYIRGEVAALDELLDALLRGDGARAGELAAEHVQDAARFLASANEPFSVADGAAQASATAAR